MKRLGIRLVVITFEKIMTGKFKPYQERGEEFVNSVLEYLKGIKRNKDLR